MLKEFDITDKAVLITGAGRGIGRGVAEVFADAGADLVLNARTPAHLEAAAAEIAESSGRRVVPVVADLNEAGAEDELVAVALRELGRVDVLINMVGDAAPGPFTELTDDGVRAQLDLNLGIAMRCCRAAGRHFVERGAGKVVNVSSVSSIRGGANLVVYATAKAGVDALTRALAHEWAPFGITVNCIAPGIFPDPRSVGTPAFDPAALVDRIPLGRLGDVREIGFLALYLASPASDYVTGQVIFVDGGMSI